MKSVRRELKVNQMARFFQPKIFFEFQCDGAKCGSMCCKNWTIDVDKETAQKYLELKLPNMIWRDDVQQYMFQLRDDGSCPNLNEDGLCKIQKSHGESFLSNTCRQYPRHVQSIGDVLFTRSLTLTCPVASELILRQSKPLEFVETEEDFPKSVQSKIEDLSGREAEVIVEVRLASIRILQNRRMTINQRLLTLGFFLSQIGNVIVEPDVVHDNVQMLDELCASEKFLRENLPKFCRAIKFDAEYFCRIMFQLLESMYGKDSAYNVRLEFRDFLQSMTIFMSEEDSVSISHAAKKYLQLDSIRAKIFKHASPVLENSMINNWWIQCLPFRFNNITLMQNYFFFVIMTKLQEFVLTAYLETQRLKKKSLNKPRVEEAAIQSAAMFSMIFEHSPKLTETISGISRAKGDDLLAMMNSMLQF